MSRRRHRRVVVHSASLALAAFLICAGLWVAIGALAAPARSLVGPPPAGFPAEPVRIPSESRSTLAGWFARGEPGHGAVLLLHGVRANRTTMVGRARFLRSAGYTVLLVDLQAHGESPGERITFGARESLDARAALSFLRRAVPRERIGALGVSLGGASLLLGPYPPAANMADAVVLEAVYPTIEEAIADRLRLRLGAAGPPLMPLLAAQLRPRIGIGPEELRPIDRIGELDVPVLVVAGAEDRHTTLAESRRLFATAPDPKALWIVPDATHEDLHAAAGADYEQRLLTFLRRYLRPAG